METSNGENQPIIRKDLGLYISPEITTSTEHLRVTAAVGKLDKYRGKRHILLSGDIPVAKTPTGPNYYGVFDGMGGKSKDHESASIGVEEIGISYKSKVHLGKTPSTPLAIDAINHGFNAAHKKIAAIDGGSTLALVTPTVDDGEPMALLSWCGDSQIYRTRNRETVLVTPTDNLISRYLNNEQAKLMIENKLLNCTDLDTFKKIMDEAKGLFKPESTKDSFLADLYTSLEDPLWYQFAWNSMQSITSGLGSEKRPTLHHKRVPIIEGDIFTICSDGLDPLTLNEKSSIINLYNSETERIVRMLEAVDKVKGLRFKKDDASVVSACFSLI